MERVGIIGFGLIGKKRLEAVKSLGLKTEFIVDPNIIHQENLLIKNTRILTDISDVSKSDLRRIDALFICLPHNLIYPTFLQVSNYVSKILIEKPLGLTFAESQEISAIANENGISVCGGFNYRFMSHIKRLKQLIEENYFGEILSISFALSHGGRPGMQDEWKLKKQFSGGGVIIDPGIHLIDLANYLCEDEIKVENVIVGEKFWKTGVEDYCSLNFKSRQIDLDIQLNLFSWKNIFRVIVNGSEGYANLEGRGGNYGDMKIEFCKRWHWDKGLEMNYEIFETEDSFLQETKEFLFNFDSPTVSKLADCLAAMRIVKEIYG